MERKGAVAGGLHPGLFHAAFGDIFDSCLLLWQRRHLGGVVLVPFQDIPTNS